MHEPAQDEHGRGAAGLDEGEARLERDASPGMGALHERREERVAYKRPAPGHTVGMGHLGALVAVAFERRDDVTPVERAQAGAGLRAVEPPTNLLVIECLDAHAMLGIVVLVEAVREVGAEALLVVVERLRDEDGAGNVVEYLDVEQEILRQHDTWEPRGPYGLAAVHLVPCVAVEGGFLQVEYGAMKLVAREDARCRRQHVPRRAQRARSIVRLFPAPEDRDVGVRLLEGAERLGQQRRFEVVIGVEKPDVFAACVRQAGVTCCGSAAIAVMVDRFHAPILLRSRASAVPSAEASSTAMSSQLPNG